MYNEEDAIWNCDDYGYPKQSLIKRFYYRLERYCSRYVYEEFKRISHTKWQEFKFRMVSKIEFRMRKWLFPKLNQK